jgi:hypothetical protein
MTRLETRDGALWLVASWHEDPKSDSFNDGVGKKVVKGWESFSGWYWFAVEQDGTHEGKPRYFGYVQGSGSEWGYFTEAELDSLGPRVWKIKPGDLPISGRRYTARKDTSDEAQERRLARARDARARDSAEAQERRLARYKAEWAGFREWGMSDEEAMRRERESEKKLSAISDPELREWLGERDFMFGWRSAILDYYYNLEQAKEGGQLWKPSASNAGNVPPVGSPADRKLIKGWLDELPRTTFNRTVSDFDDLRRIFRNNPTFVKNRLAGTNAQYPPPYHTRPGMSDSEYEALMTRRERWDAQKRKRPAAVLARRTPAALSALGVRSATLGARVIGEEKFMPVYWRNEGSTQKRVGMGAARTNKPLARRFATFIREQGFNARVIEVGGGGKSGSRKWSVFMGERKASSPPISSIHQVHPTMQRGGP